MSLNLSWIRYQCDVCNKRFTEAGNLEIHKRIHTGENLMNVMFVTKKIRSFSNLSKHEVIKHKKNKDFTHGIELESRKPTGIT